MNSKAKPKQFLELHGKPVIIYTLQHFEAHSEIDDIVVVCLKNWINELRVLLRKYYINKVNQILPGGNGGHESIYIGLKAMENVCAYDDITLIHDGVRPLINADLISDNIETAKKYGAAITVESAYESVIRSQDGDIIDSVPKRDEMFTAKAPQTFRYGLIWNSYQRARAEGIPTIDSAHLLSIYGIEMRIVKSPPNNMKITAPADYYIFRALYDAMENQQILGV
jgi:2-C-methyl-D-erythritol 4-phosphate cytidylyltransferase